MKFKKISARLFAGIVPFVCVALVVVIAISTAVSKKEIGIQIDEKMQSFMDSTDSALANSMKEIENITDSMAVHLGKTLKNGQDLSEINKVMAKYIEDSELIVAMGVFFNPEYWRGPIINDYVVYDSGKMLVMDLTDTDLTQTEWYIHCSTEKTPFFTETYVDTTIGILMTSYVSPILDEKGNFVGVVNTDVDMSVIQNYVAEAAIGETGKVALISTEGFYLSSVPAEMILVNTIYEDEEFADIADSILTGEYQMFETNKGRVVFSRAVNNYDWILLITMDSADMYSAITELVSTTTVVGIISVIICILAIGLISASIVKPIVKLNGMTDQMAAGDYSIEPAKVNSKDEVGKMSEALNSMLSSNRNEMLEISKNSSIVSENCNTLNEAVDDLNDSFNVIKDAISEINELMMDNSATTEELSASVTEVKKAVDDLSEESRNSNQLSLEVRQRATKIGAESKKNFDEAMELNKQYEEKLSVSIENSKVVEDIERMAIAINDIADQINLLSLNASIEAARAGESGRGFAVVAGEIGNLANQTAQTVAEIQTTIVKVKESVSALANDSHKLIEFINDKVSPDYKAFVDTASQYEKDAVSMQELSSFVSEIAQNLSETMSDVNIAINSIAEASQGSAEKSSVIINSVDTVAHHVEDVEAISAEQKNISDTLDEVVKRYKL